MKDMKLYKKILIGISSFIAIILIFCCSVILTGTCFKSYNDKIIDGKNWMSKVSDNAKISEIKIPGSHDSTTYDSIWLSKTQYLTIEQQCNSGVRYFDLRIKKISENEYITYHGPINGVKFEPILDEFANFLSTNKSETLILDFQHFVNDCEDYVFEKVNEKLGDYVIKNETSLSDLEFIDDLTLKDARGKCIVFFGYGSHKDSNFIFERNNDECSKKNTCLDSCYYTERNNKSSTEYIEKSLPFYIDKIKEKISNEGHKGLFVLQGQLTDSLYIFGPYAREKNHKENMNKYIKDLKDKEFFGLINIIMRDFIDFDVASNIFNLNFD